MKKTSKNKEAAGLTEQEKEKLRCVLIDNKQRIMENARLGLELSMNRDTDIGRDSIDESTGEEMLSTALRLRDREKRLLDKIDNALERLNNGTIDECEDCGRQIGFRRLMVRPVTTLCIDCKEEREIQEDMLETGHSRTLYKPTDSRE